ncbi:MAG: GNAT family N-acetyltransferase [Candidatus Diapherotrites archaeon]
MNQKLFEMDGKKMAVRRPAQTDELRWKRFLKRLEPQATHMRVFELQKDEKWVENMRKLEYDHRGVTRLAVEKNEIIGFANIVPQGKEYNFGVAVLSEFQGKGLASVLSKEIIEQAKEWKLFPLVSDTREENLPAQKLSEKLGFREEKRENTRVFYRFY